MEPEQEAREGYWKGNLTLIVILLSIWFAFGFVIPYLLGPWLNQFTFLGGPLGFWVAQNGSIYVFWILILVYALQMNRLDRRFNVGE